MSVPFLHFHFKLCEHLALFSLIHFHVFILQQMGNESLPYHWVCYVFEQPQKNQGIINVFIQCHLVDHVHLTTCYCEL